MPTATDPARVARPNPRPVTGWVRSLRSSATHLPADRLSTGPGVVVTIQGCGWRLWRGIETCRLRRAREASGRAPAELRRVDPGVRGSPGTHARDQVVSGTSEMNICPGAWDTAYGIPAAATTACGVTPQAQNTGTSPSASTGTSP